MGCTGKSSVRNQTRVPEQERHVVGILGIPSKADWMVCCIHKPELNSFTDFSVSKKVSSMMIFCSSMRRVKCPHQNLTLS